MLSLNLRFFTAFDIFPFSTRNEVTSLPSGIDNTASTYGGMLSFQKNLEGGPNVIHLLKAKEPILMVMGNTGLTANTKAAVEGVRQRRETNPEQYTGIFQMAQDIYSKARLALGAHDLTILGLLMDANHKILQEIEVSHPKLDELVAVAKENGALGAKMTGGGLGGYMIALCPDTAVQEKVAAAMEDAGYEALRTSIGV